MIFRLAGSCHLQDVVKLNANKSRTVANDCIFLWVSNNEELFLGIYLFWRRNYGFFFIFIEVDSLLGAIPECPFLHYAIILTIGMGRTLKTPKTTYTQRRIFSVICSALEEIALGVLTFKYTHFVPF